MLAHILQRQRLCAVLGKHEQFTLAQLALYVALGVRKKTQLLQLVEAIARPFTTRLSSALL